MIVGPWIPLARALSSAAALAPNVAAVNPPASDAVQTAPAEAKEAPPPPSDADSRLQYGVAFTVEGVAATGPLCVDPCVLGSGGGIAIRVGHRLSGPLYYGMAYELSKQGSNNIYRLGILQQLRAEGRYYIETGKVTQPFLQAAAGAAAYGNEWGIDTKGPMLSVGVGAQVQISRDTLVGLGLSYRAILLSSFTDSAGAFRGSGVASIFGLDLELEALDAWPFDKKH